MNNKLIEYSKDAKKRIDQINKYYDEIYDYMDDLMLDNIERILKTTSGQVAQKRVIDQIYKSEEWDKVQRSMDKYRNSKLKRMRELYRKEIDQLKELYPKSSFKMDDIATTFKNLEKMTSENTDDMLESIAGTKGDVRAIVDASKINLFVNSKERIYQFLDRTINSATKRNMKNELATAQNNLYNKMRVDFFEGIKSKHRKKFIYAGVRDANNRRVCSMHIGMIKTSSEWKNISNNQNGNMWNNRGGWNCRHYFLLVSENWQKEEVEEIKETFKSRIF